MADLTQGQKPPATPAPRPRGTEENSRAASPPCRTRARNRPRPPRRLAAGCLGPPDATDPTDLAAGPVPHPGAAAWTPAPLKGHSLTTQHDRWVDPSADIGFCFAVCLADNNNR